MDGNQRWALINNKSKIQGYLSGLNNLKLIINQCIERKIKYLTVYALSTENIKRTSSKIIFDLIRKKHKDFLNALLIKNIININIIGEEKNIPKDIFSSNSFMYDKLIDNKFNNSRDKLK